MTISELADDLKLMRSEAESRHKYAQLHLFGIKYFKILKSGDIKEVVAAAGLKPSLATEIRKGVKLGSFVELIKE